MKHLRLAWLILTRPWIPPPQGKTNLKNLSALLILFCLMLWCAIAQDANAAVNLQTCTVTPGSGGVGTIAGCPAAGVKFSGVLPTTLVRSIVNNTQGWRAFSTLKPQDQVYAADYSWHVLGTLTVTQAPTSPPIVPVVTTTWVPMNWTCSVAANVATCTAPLTP